LVITPSAFGFPKDLNKLFIAILLDLGARGQGARPNFIFVTASMPSILARTRRGIAENLQRNLEQCFTLHHAHFSKIDNCVIERLGTRSRGPSKRQLSSTLLFLELREAEQQPHEHVAADRIPDQMWPHRQDCASFLGGQRAGVDDDGNNTKNFGHDECEITCHEVETYAVQDVKHRVAKCKTH
jgi:hypothetical protein